MDNFQNALLKTNPGDTQDTPDETSDTGFNETLVHNTHFTDHHENTPLATTENDGTSETRSGAMSVARLKKNQRKPHKSFHANVTAFHAFLAGTKDRDQIDRKLKDIIALAKQTQLELNS